MKNENNEDISISVRLDKISNMLEEAIDIYRRDRDIALKNYKQMRDQLDEVLEDVYMSEDGCLERAVNAALKLVFESGKRLDKAIESTTKLMITQLINDAKVQIADKFMGGETKLTGPIDFKKLTDDR